MGKMKVKAGSPVKMWPRAPNNLKMALLGFLPPLAFIWTLPC